MSDICRNNVLGPAYQKPEHVHDYELRMACRIIAVKELRIAQLEALLPKCGECYGNGMRYVERPGETSRCPGCDGLGFVGGWIPTP